MRVCQFIVVDVSKILSGQIYEKSLIGDDVWLFFWRAARAGFQRQERKSTDIQIQTTGLRLSDIQGLRKSQIRHIICGQETSPVLL